MVEKEVGEVGKELEKKFQQARRYSTWDMYHRKESPPTQRSWKLYSVGHHRGANMG